MSESPVFLFDSSDPEMMAAHRKARESFRYFWREMAWERRRIVPALALAAVTAPFTDGTTIKRDEDTPSVEHMWINEVDFDGKNVTGVLLNSPNWLKTVKEGDSATIPLGQISDWMYAISGALLGSGKSSDAPAEVFGAFTVNLMRSRMSRGERRAHDDAWGLDFGDPNQIRLTPYEAKKKPAGFLASLFGKAEPPPATATELPEHPMSENAAPSFREELAKNPEMLRASDDRGWTFLHQQALAGSLATVQVLLDAGADVNALTEHGMTPLQLAKSLGWDKVAKLIASRGGK